MKQLAMPLEHMSQDFGMFKIIDTTLTCMANLVKVPSISGRTMMTMQLHQSEFNAGLRSTCSWHNVLGSSWQNGGP